jgi:peptide/nickel transport system ATP-binding protein/oligopeptide transport system ATP-binding protein
LNSNDRLVQVTGLRKYFPARGDWFAQLFDRREIKAVDGVSFAIPRGTTTGLVGESGSGKTTTGRLIARLTTPTTGQISYKGKDIAPLKGKQLTALRRSVQMIFQDPSSSLNRRKTAGQIIKEPLRIHRLVSKQHMDARLRDLMGQVGLSHHFLNRYPHEMSGGQRQRVGIARALAVEPEFIICDEPVTALDVSIQAQILNLLMDLQDELDLTFLFIAHDLSVVRHVSDRVSVMYLGKIVEIADTDTLFSEPKHPYTRALLDAIPKPDPRARKRMVLYGEVPSPIDPPSGCRFHPRCPEYIGDVCRQEDPSNSTLADGTQVTCHLYADKDKTTSM